ncbi:MAG: 16S rRNA (guanine(527)-N(7))-methyltransferase RsmG [Armatimonadetes bacterium]|nr:16S rRNA (guanine(527)-N(7))-methyltransferase RsmG [Armatimonadota bacterium]
MGLSVLARYCKEQGMPLDEDQLRAFTRFVRRLYELNVSRRLTSVPQEDCEVRHLVDSLLVAQFITPGTSVLDVGTGPGFPAWPLAVARPDLKLTAIDSSGKMLRILQELALPNLEVVQSRAEKFDRRESFDFATGRAVAPLAIQLELSAPFVKVGGTVVPFRTPAEQSDLPASQCEQLGLALDRVEKRNLPGTDVERMFPIFRKVGETDQRYPRTWAQIRRSPLVG